MAERRERPENARIGDERIEPAEALVQGKPEAVDPLVVLEVERHQGGGAACALDGVVELLEPADRTGNSDDMRARLR